ncbi:MAG: acyltransferase family protein [Desulfobacteraceae bacterium]|nr:acyltransferase family protein [Desulfobacteraceae bacterium]MBU4055028.1 acyltransferase family protein [Pseudomonadota bacterium]
MNQLNPAPLSHLPFLDNLRSWMVVMVLIFHSGASYGSGVKFWPFHEANPSKFIDLFMMIGDVFMMAILFFIAGYFAIPSWQKRGSQGFIKEKVRRLMIPWLVVITLVLPFLDYIHYHFQEGVNGHPVISYGWYWMLSMKNMAEFHFGWMEMSTYLNMTEHFYQRYMWFVSLLFLFFVVSAGIFEIKKRRRSSVVCDMPDKISAYYGLAKAGLLTIVLFAVIRFFIYPEFMGMGWFSLGNILQFQFGKLVIYAVYFGLGCHAFSGKWFEGRSDFGKLWLWGLVCFLLFVANMVVMMPLSRAEAPHLGLKIAFVVLYPLWVLSFLGVFTALASKYWNRSTPFNRELAANSYDMYLVHYVFPMTVPLLLSQWTGGPVFIKFGIVALTTVGLSCGISRYLIRPFPFTVVFTLVVVSILLGVLS